MASEEKSTDISEIQKFLQDNFQILALIGVFVAVAKFFAIDTANKNDAIAFLSILSTLLVIFLLGIFVISAVIQIIRNTRSKLDQGFIEFTRSSIADITKMIIVIIVAFIAIVLVLILIDQYPTQLQISLIILEMFIGLIIAAIFSIFILIRVRSLKSSFLAFAAISILTFIIGFAIDLQHNRTFNIMSLSAHSIGLILIIDVLLPLTFIKFLYYLMLAATGKTSIIN